MDGQQASIVAFCGLAVSVATVVIGAINHKRIRSECCGARGQVSFDIDTTSPVIVPSKATDPKDLKENKTVIPVIDEATKP